MLTVPCTCQGLASDVLATTLQCYTLACARPEGSGVQTKPAVPWSAIILTLMFILPQEERAIPHPGKGGENSSAVSRPVLRSACYDFLPPPSLWPHIPSLTLPLPILLLSPPLCPSLSPPCLLPLPSPSSLPSPSTHTFRGADSNALSWDLWL